MTRASGMALVLCLIALTHAKGADFEDYRRAQILRELYRSETFRGASKIESRITSPEAKAFLEGKGDIKSLSRDALENLQSGYAAIRSSPTGRDAILAMHDAAVKRLAELQLPPNLALSKEEVTQRFSDEKRAFSGTQGLSDEEATEFARHGGALDRMAANVAYRQQSQASVYGRVIANAKDLIKRAAELEKIGGDTVAQSQILRRTTALASPHPSVINELWNVTRDIVPDRKERERLMPGIKGVDLCLRVGETGPYLPVDWQTSLAKEFAARDGDAAAIARRMKDGEQNVFDEAMADILKNRVLRADLKDAKSLLQLKLRIDDLLAEKSPTSAEFKMIRRFQDRIAAERFMKLLREYPGFGRMNTEDKVALVALAARANGWGTEEARIGLVKGLVEIVGVAPLQAALKIQDTSLIDPKAIVEKEFFALPAKLFTPSGLSLLSRLGQAN